MTVLSRFLSRDVLAAAVVATVMAGPAEAAVRKAAPDRAPATRTHVAANVAKPLNVRVAASAKEDELRLAGVRKAYDGLAATRDLLHEGTRVCMKDQRWLLMKVRDGFYDDGSTPSDAYLDGAVGRIREAVGMRKAQLADSRTAAEAPAPDRDASAPLSREAQRAGPSDVERLKASVERLQGLRSSCLRWAEKTIEQVAAVTSAPMEGRLERLRLAQSAAERDYRAMQDVTPDSAREALAAMDMGSEPTTLRVGSL